MDILNDEVLIEIFKWLPGRSRRDSVRLVCQRWNQLTQTHTFMKEESVVFANAYDIRSIVPYLPLDRRKVLHLRFIGQTILSDDFENSFWQSNGERVESIEFHDSIFNFIDLITIIQFCPKLKSIKITVINDIRHLVLQNFTAFANLEFTATSVTAFHFHVNGRLNTLQGLTDYKMQKILAMFPNLIDLELHVISPYGLWFQIYNDPVSIPELFDRMMSVYGIIYSSFGVAKNLRKFCLEAPWLRRGGVEELQDLPIFLSQLNNIKELKLFGFPFLEIDHRQPCNSLLQMTKITSLHLEMPLSHSLSEFLLFVLNNFVDLRYLRLDRIGLLKMNKLLIQKLLTSSLKTLYLDFSDLLINPDIIHCDSFCINQTLETLTTSDGVRTEDFALKYLLSVFLQYFHSIQNLKMINVTDKVLQNVTFKHQKYLKNLEIQSQFLFTDAGFVGACDSTHTKGDETLSFTTYLQNLEFLRITPAQGITEKTFATFILPKLRILELSESASVQQLSEPSSPHVMPYFTKLECLVQNSPYLEELRLVSLKPVPQQELEKILSSFKRLRCVSITFKRLPYVNVNNKYRVSLKNRQPKVEEESLAYNYEVFFQLCPSLRKFVHNDKWFYINILTKKLEFRTYPRVIPFHEYLMG